MGGEGCTGTMGDEKGQFTSNLRGGRTIPVTAGGRQVSGKGVQRGIKREQQGEQGEIGRRVKETTPCIYATVTCVQRMTER